MGCKVCFDCPAIRNGLDIAGRDINGFGCPAIRNGVDIVGPDNYIAGLDIAGPDIAGLDIACHTPVNSWKLKDILARY